jgi:hypothetical protein
MSKTISKAVAVAAAVVALAGCTVSSQTSALQLPGESTRSGLQVPPDLGERPVQTAIAPAR